MDISDQVVVLDFGRVIAAGTPAAVRDDPGGDRRLSRHRVRTVLMEFLLEISLVGLAVGGVYALIALGYVIVYRTTRVVNFAHGNLMMVGAYFFFTFAVLLELPWWAALPLSICAAAVLGAGIERVLMRPRCSGGRRRWRCWRRSAWRPSCTGWCR